MQYFTSPLLHEYPSDDLEAARRIEPLLEVTPTQLAAMSHAEFCRAWSAICFLYSGLHPDEAGKHGKRVLRKAPSGNAAVAGIDERLIKPYYAQSGWPVALAPIADEAARRYDTGAMSEEEYFDSEAHSAGLFHHTGILLGGDYRN